MAQQLAEKKKLDAYLKESKTAFNEYYGMGVKPLCGDYLHDIAFQKTGKGDTPSKEVPKVIDSSDEESKE